MTPREVLWLLTSGAYRVDLVSGIVYGRAGKPVKGFGGGRNNRRFTRVYGFGKVKTLALSRLVWMAGAGRSVPVGFEVHHRDGNRHNDSWNNLLCVHRTDHAKLHAGDDDPIPF